MTRRCFVVSGVVLAALAGCTVGPDPHEHRSATVPVQFVEAVGEPAAGVPAPSIHRFAASDPTLRALLDAAMVRNDDLRIAAARVAQARALLGVAEADLYPTTDAVGGAERRRLSGNVDERAGDGRTENRFSFGFQTGWEIDLWGAVRRSVEAATFDATAALEQLHDAQRSIGAEVAAEYARVRGLQAQLDVARRGVVNQERLAAITDALARDGSGTVADVRRVAARLERTRAEVSPLEAAVRVAVHRLSVLCVVPAEEIASLLDITTDRLVTPDEFSAGLPSDLLRARPDIRAAELALSAATARIGLATADLFPRVTLTGDFGVTSTEVGNLFAGDALAFGIGPTVRWPLLDFGRVRARIRAQGAVQAAALAAYEQTVRRAVAEVETALAEHRGGVAERARLELALAAAIDAQRLGQLRYSEGVDPLDAVLDTERERLEIEQQLVAARTRVLLAYVAIGRALAAPATGPPLATSP